MVSLIKAMSKNVPILEKIERKYVTLVAAIFASILFLVIGYFVGVSIQKERYVSFLSSFKNIRQNSDRYKFINPLIGSVSGPGTEVGIFSDIKSDIVSYLKKEKKNENLYGYSLYVRDLSTGLWFGDHENDNFFPASLFKLPIALAVYKQGEDDPSFLKRRLIYTQEISNINTAVQVNSASNLTVGQSYTVEELVLDMIVLSDNGAKNLLLSSMDGKYIDQLFEAVALVDPSKKEKYIISSRQYALFLRILYGSSYLNEENSERIMEMLAKTDFKQGIVAGVPGNVEVAHKYGVYEIEEEINGVTKNARQLHDCGIVYHEDRPYIFCLMTKGKDSETLYNIVAKVSETVYEYQESKSREKN